MQHAIDYIAGIFSDSLFKVPEVKPGVIIPLVVVFMVIEWLGRDGQYAIAKIGLSWKRPIRYAFYYALLIAIWAFAGEKQEFIYFQF